MEIDCRLVIGWFERGFIDCEIENEIYSIYSKNLEENNDCVEEIKEFSNNYVKESTKEKCRRRWWWRDERIEGLSLLVEGEDDRKKKRLWWRIVEFWYYIKNFNVKKKVIKMERKVCYEK